MKLGGIIIEQNFVENAVKEFESKLLGSHLSLELIFKAKLKFESRNQKIQYGGHFEINIAENQ